MEAPKKGAAFAAVVMAMAVFAMTAITTSTAQNSPNDFVNLHNAARAEVGVSQVSWDQTRAAYAQSYASQRARDCSTMHSNTGGRIGENLWAAWGSGSHTAADAVSSWVNEKQWYDHGSNTCSPSTAWESCGHYTQVVWRDTTAIGCARVVCDNGGVFIGCNYSPPGNFGGQRPY